jgi:hypothetical protein
VCFIVQVGVHPFMGNGNRKLRPPMCCQGYLVCRVLDLPYSWAHCRSTSPAPWNWGVHITVTSSQGFTWMMPGKQCCR